MKILERSLNLLKETFWGKKHWIEPKKSWKKFYNAQKTIEEKITLTAAVFFTGLDFFAAAGLAATAPSGLASEAFFTTAFGFLVAIFFGLTETAFFTASELTRNEPLAPLPLACFSTFFSTPRFSASFSWLLACLSAFTLYVDAINLRMAWRDEPLLEKNRNKKF